MTTPAEKLNGIMGAKCPALLSMLSARGRAVYFPYGGILGQTAEAKGKKYNATIGIAYEEDGSPMRLACMSDAVQLEPSAVFPYAPSFGLPAMREAWGRLMREKNPSLAGKSFSLPVVTQALTHGLFTAGMLFLDRGDDLLIPAPYWDNYDLIFETELEARVAAFQCFAGGGFNIKGLQAELSARRGHKIVILLNFPNNPTGYTPSEKEMSAIASELIRAAEQGSRVVVVIDDAYFGLVYEKGIATESLFTLLADAHENLLAVKLDAATKEEYVWGLRVGFISFAAKGADESVYKALADKAAGVVRGNISNASNLSQSLVIRALKSSRYAEEKREKYGILKRRYEIVRDELSRRRGEYGRCFEPLPFNSGYFMCLKPAPGIDAEKVRKLLIEKYDTGIIATSGLIRIAFSSVPSGDIPALLENVFKACLEMKTGA